MITLLAGWCNFRYSPPDASFDKKACAVLARLVEIKDPATSAILAPIMFTLLAGWCDFRYSPPDASFDKKRVHGVLARLVQVKDPATTLALEVAAGSRLYQVRVVMSQLLNCDKLKLNSEPVRLVMNFELVPAVPGAGGDESYTGDRLKIEIELRTCAIGDER